VGYISKIITGTSDFLILFHLYFDKDCWSVSLEERESKDVAAPSSFQHVSPEQYITVVYDKLCQSPIAKEIGHCLSRQLTI